MTRVQDPLTIRGKIIKNRMTMAPTVKFDFAGEDGMVSQKHIEHYKERAEHGIGLICVEATAVTPGGRFGKIHMGLWEDAQIDGHRMITEACHKNGVCVLIQLNHTGITSNPECGSAIGPSAVPTRFGGLSKELTVEEIHELQQAFVDAAVRAQKAGYDGIQLHGCHGYLINQFVCRTTNLRTDAYGGSPENRARFAVEILQKIREECGEDFLLSVRTVGADPDLADAIAVAEEYIKAGCDFLQVSHGIEKPDPSLVDGTEPYTLVCSLGVHFHDYFKGRVPVSCVGHILEPEDVHYLIENDLVDAVDLARAELADPSFPEAVLDDTSFVKCFECKRCQYGPFTDHRCPAEAFRRRRDLKAYEERVEELLERPYRVIDLLPKQVPADSDGQYFAVERFYTQAPFQEEVNRKFAHLLIKLNCYFDLTCVADKGWVENPDPKELYQALTTGSQGDYLNILLPSEESLIAWQADDLYITLYHPSEELLALVEKLAAAEGLFVR